MACERKFLESEATTGFFFLLGQQGNKAVLDWVMKEGLIPSRYECPKCKKDMRLVERKGTIDGFEWRCRVQSKKNPHFVCRSRTGYLGDQPGRGRKSTRSDVVEDVATAIVNQSMDNVIGCSSARAVSRHLGVPYSTAWNVLRKVVHFFPYKIHHNQQLMANDREKRLTFALTFLARVEVDASWPWKILWSDEAHFHLSGTVNTHNSRISDT
ncbi:uncharacterized protein TNCV_5046721 [Trichonephila clavipes]|nr:uncharacterized protein TNCV_5046721 [Trichonephila clavipes]